MASVSVLKVRASSARVLVVPAAAAARSAASRSPVVGHLAHGGGDRGQRAGDRAGHHVAEHHAPPRPPPGGRDQSGAEGAQEVQPLRARAQDHGHAAPSLRRRLGQRPAQRHVLAVRRARRASASRAGAAPAQRRARARPGSVEARTRPSKTKATSLSVSAPSSRRARVVEERSPADSVPRTSGGSAPMVIGHGHDLQHAARHARGRSSPRRGRRRRPRGTDRRLRRGPLCASRRPSRSGHAPASRPAPAPGSRAAMRLHRRRIAGLDRGLQLGQVRDQARHQRQRLAARGRGAARSSAARVAEARARSSASASRATRLVTNWRANAIESTATTALARKMRLRSEARNAVGDLIAARSPPRPRRPRAPAIVRVSRSWPSFQATRL